MAWPSLRGKREQVEHHRQMRLESFDENGHRLARLQRTVRRRPEALGDLRPHASYAREEELLLGGEVSVEGPLRDLCGAADVVDSHLRVPVARERRRAGVEKARRLRRDEAARQPGVHEVVPHLRPERAPCGQLKQLGEDSPDGRERKTAPLAQQPDEAEALDVARVVEEPVRRDPSRRRKQARRDVVANRRGRDSGPGNELGHRETLHHGRDTCEECAGLDRVGAVRKVALVTDSSTCLPPDLIEALAIRVVPITVHLPDVDRVDGSDQLSRRISEAVERDQYVRSSHPFITDYLAAIEDCGTPTVVVVTPAMEFAGMYRNAALAAELSRATAVAVDSRTAAAGQALVVLAGAEAADRGADLDEVLAVIEDASRRVDLVASLEALGPLRRSRRVPSNALRRLGLEGQRSVFRMRDGGVEPLREAATAELALEAIREAWSSCPAPGPERCTVFHADCPDLAASLTAAIGRVDFVSGFSAAMQIHTGRGVVGAAWLEPPDGRT